MASYVDDAFILYKGKLRCHMTADSIEELHQFAQSIGVKRCWFHSSAKRYPHYDITDVQRDFAIANGCIPVNQYELVPLAKKISKLNKK